MLKLQQFNTKLGDVVGVGDDKYLYLLLFHDFKKLPQLLNKLESYTKSKITDGDCASLSSIKSEINSYFKGSLQEFKTPIMHFGTDFQKKTWNGLGLIPYGKTISYAELAHSIGMPNVYRAAANANGANKLVIITPCHRVVASGGGIGGYSSGLDRKKLLLDLEGV